MVATKVTGGRAWGSAGAAILRADLPKGMTTREFLEINRRVNKGGGSDKDQEIINQVFGNALARQSGYRGGEEGMDLRKSPNKKYLSAHKKRLKARRKEEKALIESKIKTSLETRTNTLVSRIKQAKTQADLDKLEPVLTKFSSRQPDFFKKIDKKTQRPVEQSPEWNKEKNRLYSRAELNSLPKVRSAVRKENAIRQAALRRAEIADNAYGKVYDRYVNKVWDAFDKQEYKVI